MIITANLYHYTDKKKVYKQRKKTGSSSFQRIVFFTLLDKSLHNCIINFYCTRGRDSGISPIMHCMYREAISVDNLRGGGTQHPQNVEGHMLELYSTRWGILGRTSVQRIKKSVVLVDRYCLKGDDESASFRKKKTMKLLY